MGDFRQIAAEYSVRLAKAHKVATERLGLPDVTLGPIDVSACSAFDAHWRAHPDRLVNWDWTAPNHRRPKGLNVAVWHGNNLCGLASGRLTASRAVRVDYIEGYPEQHALKGIIIPAVLTCAEAYRIVIGARELKLYDVHPPLIPVYGKFGFELLSEDGKVHVMRKITL